MRPPREPLAAFDAMAAFLGLGLAILLLVFPLVATPFRRLLESLGGAEPRVAMAAVTWLGPASGVVLGALLAYAAILARPGLRRVLLVIGAAFGVLMLAGCFGAIQWAIWHQLDSIRAD